MCPSFNVVNYIFSNVVGPVPITDGYHMRAIVFRASSLY
jgi:hypothetical protein